MKKRCKEEGRVKDQSFVNTISSKNQAVISQKQWFFLFIAAMIFISSLIGIFPFSEDLIGYDYSVLASAENYTYNSNLTTFLSEYIPLADNYAENFHPYHWEQHHFVAVYTQTDGTILTDHDQNKCYINFSDSPAYVLMRSNGSIYVYNRTFPAGNYSYSVICNSTGIYNTTKTNESFEIFPNPLDTFSKTNFDDIGSKSVVAWADYDNDDDLDFFMTGTSTFFYEQDAPGSFSKDSGISITTGEERNIAFADIDNDEDLDLMINNHHESGFPSNHFLKIFKNINNNYSEFQELDGTVNGEMLIFDYDKDGYNDLAKSGLKQETIVIIRHNIDKNNRINFSNITSLTGLTYSHHIRINDILLTQGSTNELPSGAQMKLYSHSGFTLTEQQSFNDTYRGSATVGDINQDGDLDIVVSGYNGTDAYTTIVYRWQNNQFEHAQELQGIIESSSFLGDLNNDGYMDLLLAGYNGSDIILYYENNHTHFIRKGSLDFEAVNNGLGGKGSIAMSDYDEDGDLDILTTGNDKTILYTNNFSLYRSNTRPSAPVAFTTSYTNLLNFTWSGATDDTTDHLYYNLRVGTSPGQGDVLSGKFGGCSGSNYCYLGNAMQQEWYALNISENTTYYWQVQSIDAAYSISGWSPVQTYYPDSCQPTNSSWTIANTCTYVDQNIVVTSDIKINNSMTLINSTLTASSITVDGTLNATSSTISSPIIFNSTQSTITDSTLDAITNYGINNTITNTTYSSLNIQNNSLLIRYYLDLTVMNQTGSLLAGTAVKAYDTDNRMHYDTATDSPGKARLVLTSDRNNGTSSIQNYTIYFQRSGYNQYNMDYTHSSNTALTITLNRSSEPIFSNYYNSLTTNFSEVSDVSNVSAASIGLPGFGMIMFNENIDVSNLDLNSIVNISQNNIDIDVSAAQGLNRRANITIFNLNFSAIPAILRNDQVCSDCTVIDYTNGNLTFNVSGFSNYSAASNSLLETDYSPSRLMINQTVTFTANYSNTTSHLPISENCTISLDSTWHNMSYTGAVHTIDYNFTSLGDKQVTIRCNMSGYETLNHTFSITVKPNSTAYDLDEQGVYGTSFGSSLLLADLDSNHYHDIFISGPEVLDKTTTKGYVYSNTNAFFTPHDEINLPDLMYGGISLADPFNDETYDIITSGQRQIDPIEKKLYIIRYQSGWTYDDSSHGINPVYYSSHAWLDYNNDGLIDLITCGTSDSAAYSTSLYTNNGDSFSKSVINFMGVTECSVNAVNLDNDNFTDIIVSGRYGNADDEFTTKVYMNNQAASFTNTQNLTGVKFGHITSGDIDNNGYMDIVLIGCSSGTSSPANCTDKIAKVYQNNANNLTYSPAWSQNLTAVWKGSLTLGDYNNDGLLDLLLAGTTRGTWTDSITKLYYSNGTTFIEDTFNTFDGSWAGSLAFADYNNDNNLDIFYTGFNESQSANTRIYRSDANELKNNTLPAPPTAVNISYNNSRMKINWTAGSDAESPVLYYNLKIGSSPTNQNILSSLNPLSTNPPQGYFGNMQLLQEISLDIPPRCAYVQVQSIDSSHQKSAWSAQVSYSTAEICDSYDNDCDQLADEDWDNDDDGQIGIAYAGICTNIDIFDCDDEDGGKITGGVCGNRGTWAHSGTNTCTCVGEDEDEDEGSSVSSGSSSFGGGSPDIIPQTEEPAEETTPEEQDDDSDSSGRKIKEPPAFIIQNYSITYELSNQIKKHTRFRVHENHTEIIDTIRNPTPLKKAQARLRITIPKDIINTTDHISSDVNFTIIQRDPKIEFALGDLGPYEEIHTNYTINKSMTEEEIGRISYELMIKEQSRIDDYLDDFEIYKAKELAKQAIQTNTTTVIYDNGSAEATVKIKPRDDNKKAVGVGLPIHIPKCLVEMLTHEYAEQVIDANFNFTITKADPEIFVHFEEIDDEMELKLKIKQVEDINCDEEVTVTALVASIVTRFGEPPKLLDYLTLAYFFLVFIVIIVLVNTTNIGKLKDHANKHPILKPLVWSIREFILLYFIFLLALSILDIMGMLGDLDFVKKMMSLLLAFILILKTNISERLFGKRSRITTALILIFCSLWWLPALEEIFIGLFGKYGFFGRAVKTILYLMDMTQDYTGIALISLFVIISILSYRLIIRNKDKSSFASNLLKGNYSPFRIIKTIIIIIITFFIFFQMIIEGFSIATDSIILISVALIFMIYHVIRYRKLTLSSLTEAFNAIEDFVRDIIVMLQDEGTYWVSISIRIFYIIGLGFIIFILSSLLPFMPQPEIYAQGFTAQSPSVYDLIMQSTADPLATYLIYVMNMIAILILFYIPFKIYSHIFYRNAQDTVEPKRLSFSRWTLISFAVSLVFFILTPIFQIKKINSNLVVGNEIVIKTLPEAIRPDIPGMIIAGILLVFIVAHMIRKHNHLMDIITHVIPAIAILFYFSMYFSSISFNLNILALSLISATVGIWAYLVTRKHKKIIEIKTVTIAILLVFVYTLFFLKNFIYHSIILYSKVIPDLTLNYLLFDYILDLMKIAVYIWLHIYMLYAFISELHANNEFGFHKYHIWLFDKSEIANFLHHSRFTPEKLRQKRYKDQQKRIKKELDKGMDRKADPHHLINYLIHHSYDINLISYTILIDEGYKEYYSKGLSKVLSEMIQELMVQKDPDDVAFSLLRVHCSPKMLGKEIAKAGLSPQAASQIYSEFSKYYAYTNILHSHGSERILKHHYFTKDAVKRYTQELENIKPIIFLFNTKTKDHRKLAENLLKKGWSKTHLKDALYLSNAKDKHKVYESLKKA